MQIEITNASKPHNSVSFHASRHNIGSMISAYAANCKGDRVAVSFDGWTAFCGDCGLTRWNLWTSAGDESHYNTAAIEAE